MAYILGVFIIIIILLVLYVAILWQQLRNINLQLDKRLTKNTRQPIHLELMNHQLNELTININKCLKAEETLRLESVQEEKRFKELITNVSHDLRTPLTAIKGYQQLMMKDPLTEDQKAKLLVAMKHTEELGRLIEHFYEYTYLVNVEPQLEMERINITNLVTECLVESIAMLEEHDLSVYFEEVPPIFIVVDKEMIIRMIQNLIRNCVQHSAGAIEVKLLTGYERVEVINKYDSVTLSVSNPIKPGTLIEVDRLFDRFYVGDKARTASTGLGLSIVKLLAEQMNGTVSATLEKDILDIRVHLPMGV